jgi:hypothetical protein
MKQIPTHSNFTNKKEEKTIVSKNNLIPNTTVPEIKNIKMQKMVRNYLNNYVDFNYLN